jgi:hypothetical protein
MSKANEKKLSDLHGAVAEVLLEQVTRTEEETYFDQDGVEQSTGEVISCASPATLAQAIKFLKDNEITCDVEQNENMNNLREVLKSKQKHSRLLDASRAAQQLDA